MALTKCVNVRIPKDVYYKYGCPDGFFFDETWNNNFSVSAPAYCSSNLMAGRPIKNWYITRPTDTGLLWCSIEATLTSEPPIPTSYKKGTCSIKSVLGDFPPVNGLECNEYALFIGLTSAICAYLFWHQVIK